MLRFCGSRRIYIVVWALVVMGSENLEGKAEDVSVRLPVGLYIEGKSVCEFVAGGPGNVVGYVEGGVAYEFVCGGKPRPITGSYG